MSSDTNNKVVLITAAAAAIVTVSAVFLLTRKKADDDDGIEFSKSDSVPKKSVPRQEKAPEPKSGNTTQPHSTISQDIQVDRLSSTKDNNRVSAANPSEDDLLEEALKEVNPTVSAAPAVTPEASTPSEGSTNLPHLGVSMKPPAGWEVREELSPVPNVAMVSVWNPEFANASDAETPGAVPVIILSVEDIRGENLNLNEFKERSKTLSTQQMLMMTGGAISPQIRKDAAQQNGPYRHIIEYAQSLPPFLDIYVINLLDVRNGLAYVFQIMCNPKVMNEYRSVFFQIAKDTVITPLTTSALGYVAVYTGKIEAHIDSTWNWTIPSADSECLAQFETSSTVKREEIVLYEAGKVPSSEHKVREEKEVDGVKIVSSFDGAQERKLVSYGDYVLVISPQQKAISFIPEQTLVGTIKSIKPSSEAPKRKDGATYFCPEYNFKFDIVGGSRVVATKLGNGTLVYAPLGVPQDMTQEVSPEEQGPTVTVRTGSPSNDPDCMGSLEEWHARMKEEAAEGNIHNIKLTKVKDYDCLTFTSKEMQEVGPGQKVEIKGSVYIFVRDGVTTLIRWETTTSLWRKFESDLNNFLDSFEFTN